VDQVRDLSAVLIQSERHGASIGKALRNYADMARQERQMWAEEMSQKAAVKIVFPTLLCIFPAMFIVLLGPAAMQMSKLFAK
jgi:tight adherence protein C